MIAITTEFERKNASLCIYCGQVLAALKMPGGQLPWDTDVDSPMLTADFDHVIDNVMPIMTKYGLKPVIRKGSKIFIKIHLFISIIYIFNKGRTL